LIASAQRVEHYEIAAYGCVRTCAKVLGDTKAGLLLDQTLQEEGATDKKLTERKSFDQYEGREIVLDRILAILGDCVEILPGSPSRDPRAERSG
jgi:Domain of unknown function (DUF892)